MAKKKHAVEEVPSSMSEPVVPSQAEVESNVETIKEETRDVPAPPLWLDAPAVPTTAVTKPAIVAWVVCELKTVDGKPAISTTLEAWDKGRCDRFLAAHTASSYMFLMPVMVDPDDCTKWQKI